MKTLTKMFTLSCWSLLTLSLLFSTNSVEDKLRLEQERLEQKTEVRPMTVDPDLNGIKSIEIEVSESQPAVKYGSKPAVNFESSDPIQEKINYYHNLKKDPGDPTPYEGSRDCVDTDNGATDPYGDGCAAYNNYPSWCGNYNDDDFVSEEMCCICGGGSTSGGDTGGDDAGSDDGGFECEYDVFTLTMIDAYGDGWNGNQFCIGDQCATLDSGDTGTADFCVDMSVSNSVSCDGGSWQSEVSWSLADADGNEALSGGAPYYGCLGECSDATVYGCMDPNSPNYDSEAEVDDGTCEFYVGADYGYWNEGYAGYIIGCGLYYIFEDSDGDGMPDALGDGTCDSYGDVTGDGLDNGLGCEYFSCDMGDCVDCSGVCLGEDVPAVECWDGSSACVEEDCPEDTCDGLTVLMVDSYGDGWNGNILTIGDQTFTLETGESGAGCYTGPMDVIVTCDGGSWQTEVSWSISDDSGVLLEGGAPYSGCLGNCDGETFGCTDPNAPEYNPEATTDDGSCWADCPYPQWLADGYCDGSNNIEACGFDQGDCCPGDCVDTDSYDCATFGGTCEDCIDPNSADLAEDGQCYDDGTDDGGTTGGGWDAVVTNFTAEGVDYYGDAAVSWTWDALADGTSCEENGQITCEDGTCADSEDLCPEIPWPDCTGNLSWLGDGYCDGSNNNEACGWDLGDCCPGDCEALVAEGCPENPDGCYSTISCGDCGSCDDPNSPDNAEGGACSDYVQWTDAECAASVTIAGSADLDGDGYIGDNDLCYSDGTGYFSFNWEGGCTGTNLYYIDSDGVEQNLDLTAYGFTSGFYFYGFGNLEEVPFIVSFAEADTDLIVAATDCPGDDAADDGGSDDAGSDDGGSDCVDTDNGATDPYGDGCAAYNDYPSWCGNYDDDDFFSMEMCCICGGGEGGAGSDDGGSDDGGSDDAGSDDGGEDCEDSDNGATDPYGDGCAEYANYPSWCGGYDDDDFTSCEMCCACADEAACTGVMSHENNVPALSINASYNAKNFQNEIAVFKKNSIDLKAANIAVDFSHEGAMFNLETMEFTPGSSSSSNRTVSYTLDVTCDACLSGGPWSGQWETTTAEFLVYGFDDASTVCATVTAVSTEFGSTAPSQEECVDAGDQSACEFFDCSGQEACGFEGWVGDGYCDDGTYDLYFNCADFNCDEGDCVVECWDGSTACAGNTECPEEPTCSAGDVNDDGNVNVSDIVVVVNFILGGGTAGDVCDGDMNGDAVVNVSDIVQIVNYILGGGTARLDSASNADVVVTNNSISVEADGFVQGVQMTLTHGDDFAIELTDAYISDYRTIGNTTTLLVVTDGTKSLSEVASITGKCTVENATVATPAGEAQSNVSMEIASAFEVKVAGPNPFNPSTSLNVIVDQAGYVSVKVFNLMGQQVATLADGYMDANSAGYTLHWNASQMASGVYLVHAESAGKVSTQKLMLLK